jgi:polyisoprenoid-binding protein YceI
LNRRLLFGVAAVVVLALAAIGVYAFQFFTPQKAAPSKTAATLSTPSSSPAVGGALTGKWVVSSGSSAGYRATEQFVGVTGPNQAIADSTAVSGGMTIVDAGEQLVARQLKVDVDLTQLHSSDPGSSRGGLQRDGFVRSNWLQSDQFPTGTYAVDSVTIPATTAEGGQQLLTTRGKLTIHGTTKDVDIPMMGQVTGSKIEIVGSIVINMTDYGVQPPSLNFTSVQPKVTIVFHVFFARG